MKPCVNCGCDPEVQSKGILINRCAWLGSQIQQLRDRIPQLEKTARKTPPKTLLAEKAKVEAAKVQLKQAQEDLTRYSAEWESLKQQLGYK